MAKQDDYKCYLISKNNYPVAIKYDGKNVMIPPRARKILFLDERLLQEKLPNGIIKIK